MKEYVSPVAEFIEFEDNDIITNSLCGSDVCDDDEPCNDYVCNGYGNICDGEHVNKSRGIVSKSKDDIVKVGFDLTFDK